MEPVGERGDGDGPVIFELDEMIDGREFRRVGQHAAARHQERGGEGMRLALGLPPLRFAMPMQDQVAQLVRGVEPAVLGRFLRVQEDEGLAVTPHREGIHFRGVDRQREHPDAAGFEQMDHVLDWQLAKAPELPHRCVQRPRGRPSC